MNKGIFEAIAGNANHSTYVGAAINDITKMLDDLENAPRPVRKPQYILSLCEVHACPATHLRWLCLNFTVLHSLETGQALKAKLSANNE